jgi:hypothetical protein
MGLPDRKLNWLYILKMASRETLPVLKEVPVDHSLQILVLVAKITGKFILGLDILCAHSVTVVGSTAVLV